MRSIVLTIVLVLSLVSCNSLFVQQKWQHATKQNLLLASVGKTTGNLITRDFQIGAFPKYNKGIRLSLNYVAFTQLSYSAYKKAVKQQEKKDVFNYDKKDENKTYFLKLQLADAAQIISELNNDYNEKIINWLKDNPKAKIVTGLSMYLSQQALNDIKKADKVLLVNHGYKDYAIQCYINNKKYKTLSFKDAVVFGYDLSSFCWGQTRGVNFNIRALTKETNSCAKGQFKSFIKAQKSREINIKF